MSEFLDRVRTDLAAATPGPWRAALLDGVDYDDGSSSYRGGIYPAHIGAPPIILTNGVDRRNARLIASAPDRLDKMERALRAVTVMHSRSHRCGRTGHTGGIECIHCETVCSACDEAWPCSTVTTILEVLGDE